MTKGPGGGQFNLPFTFGTERPERRSLVIEAGAGTGKTTSIVSELLSILVDEPELSADRIVLVTFTEKAAGEIAGRIRDAIRDLHDTFDRGEPHWPAGSSEPIFRIEREQRERARAAIDAHYAQLDRFYSQTIHSFCQRVLRLFPLEARLNPQFSVVEGYERNRLYDQMYGEWLQEETVRDRRPEWIAQWDIALGHFNRLDFVRSTIFLLLSKRDLLSDERFSLGSIEEATPLMFRMIGGIRSATAAQMKSIDDEAVAATFAYFRANQPPDEPSLEDWIEYLLPVSEALMNINLPKVPKELRDQMKFLRGDKKEENIFQRLLNHRAAVTVRALAERFFRYLDRRKEERGVVDFDDLLLRTAELLRDKQILESVRSHFDYIFVDEFQDTDRVQAEIVDALSRDTIGRLIPGRTVIVGDPKQSIYSFRRADPETYEATVRRFLDDGAAPRTLSDQYRSDAPLVDALNAMFSELFSLESTRYVARPGYDDLTPRRPELLRELDARVSFLRWDGPADLETDERQAVAIAEWISAQVAEGSSYRRFSVLLRKLTNVERYLETFDRYGIPYVLPPTRAFLERRAAVDVMAVLRAIAYPWDAAALYTAARSPYFAVSDTEIARQLLSPSATDGTWEEFQRHIEGYVEDARHLSVAALIDRIVAECEIEHLYRLSADGARQMMHLEAMRDMAAEFDLRAGGSAAEFVEEIARRRDTAEEGEPSWIDDTADAVAIMTVHAAKGLEFETVILPDLFSGMRSDAIRMFAVDEPPTLLFTGQIANLGGEFRDAAGGPKLSEIGSARLKAETDRLFYVAVTRAKSDVVFVTDQKDKKGAFWDCINRIFKFEPKTMPAQFPSAPGREVVTVPIGLRTIPVGFERVEATLQEDAIVQPLNVDPASLQVVDTEIPEHRLVERLSSADAARLRAGGRNKRAGIMLHRVLELWDGSPTTLEPLVAAVSKELRVDEATKAKVSARLAVAAKSSFFATIRSATTVGREWPIHYVDAGGDLIEGRIDRLLEVGGEQVVLDYKTGSPEPDRLPKDRAQVERYCEAIARLTGSPCRGVLWYIDLENDAVVEIGPQQ